jgi:hypothetical protein
MTEAHAAAASVPRAIPQCFFESFQKLTFNGTLAAAGNSRHAGIFTWNCMQTMTARSAGQECAATAL